MLAICHEESLPVAFRISFAIRTKILVPFTLTLYMMPRGTSNLGLAVWMIIWFDIGFRWLRR